MKFLIFTAIAASITAGLRQGWVDFLKVQTMEEYIPNPDQFLTSEFDLIWNILSDVYENSEDLATAFDSVYYCNISSGIQELLDTLTQYCREQNPGYEAFSDILSKVSSILFQCSEDDLYNVFKSYFNSWQVKNTFSELLETKSQLESDNNNSEIPWDLDEVSEGSEDVLVITGDIYIDIVDGNNLSVEVRVDEEDLGEEETAKEEEDKEIESIPTVQEMEIEFGTYIASLCVNA